MDGGPRELPHLQGYGPARAGGVGLTGELSLLPAAYVHPPHYAYRTAWTYSAEDHRDTRFYEPSHQVGYSGPVSGWMTHPDA